MARLGDIIDGKYEILREIGKGGMSVVYLAMDKRLNKQWAIKEFRKDNENKQIALKALLDEANLIKKLDHPTLPRIVDIIESGHTIYIVMDYIEGESLNKVLDAYGAQPVEAVIEWGKQLSDVLDYLHTRTPPVIYRDMKPANIMLKPDGSVKLIDFGIAREYKEGKAGDTSNIGTRGYAAPEQFVEQGQTDARTDIYSLGVTLYHLVTGKNPSEPPYEILPIRNINPSLPTGLEWLIQKCTQLNPQDRYQSCAEVTYVLDNLDKFEVAYKTKLRSKVNIFIAMVVMTVVFAVIGTIGLVMDNSMDTKNYGIAMGKDTIAGYKEAIDIDENTIDAYLSLRSKYNDQIRKVVVLKNGEKTVGLAPDIESTQQIMQYFSAARLDKFLKENPKQYVLINYDLGLMFWYYYQQESGTGVELYSESIKYFKNVVSAAETMKDRGGLNETQYSIAKSYYIICTLAPQQDRKDRADQVEVDKAFVNLFNDEEQKEWFQASAVDPNRFILRDSDKIYWGAIVKLLDLQKGQTGIQDYVKLRNLSRLAYVLQENVKRFKNSGIDKAAMEEVYRKLNEASGSINPTEGTEDEEVKKKLVANLKIAKGLIEAEYNATLEDAR